MEAALQQGADGEKFKERLQSKNSACLCGCCCFLKKKKKVGFFFLVLQSFL